MACGGVPEGTGPIGSSIHFKWSEFLTAEPSDAKFATFVAIIITYSNRRLTHVNTITPCQPPQPKEQVQMLRELAFVLQEALLEPMLNIEYVKIDKMLSSQQLLFFCRKYYHLFALDIRQGRGLKQILFSGHLHQDRRLWARDGGTIWNPRWWKIHSHVQTSTWTSFITDYFNVFVCYFLTSQTWSSSCWI